MQSIMNLKIKYRESFRPFAPAVLDDQASKYFEIEPGIESPYMLLVADVRPELRVEDTADHTRGADLRTWVNEIRSIIPAVTHVDYSARLQTVARGDESRLPRHHRGIRSDHRMPGRDQHVVQRAR